MKFQIDTEAKTISFEESVELDKLFKYVQTLFPNGEWKKYKLEAKIITSWYNPIIIDRFPTYPLPWLSQPYYVSPSPMPTITCDNGDNKTQQCGIIYNVSMCN